MWTNHGVPNTIYYFNFCILFFTIVIIILSVIIITEIWSFPYLSFFLFIFFCNWIEKSVEIFFTYEEKIIEKNNWQKINMRLDWACFSFYKFICVQLYLFSSSKTDYVSTFFLFTYLSPIHFLICYFFLLIYLLQHFPFLSRGETALRFVIYFELLFLLY